MNDAHAVTDLLDQLHHVAGEHHGRPSSNITLQHLAHDLRRDGVDPLERLIQEEHARSMQEGSRQSHLLLHPMAVIDDQCVGSVCQAEHPQERGGSLCHRCPGPIP